MSSLLMSSILNGIRKSPWLLSTSSSTGGGSSSAAAAVLGITAASSYHMIMIYNGNNDTDNTDNINNININNIILALRIAMHQRVQVLIVDPMKYFKNNKS